jgi:hypothetical protein
LARSAAASCAAAGCGKLSSSVKPFVSGRTTERAR